MRYDFSLQEVLANNFPEALFDSDDSQGTVILIQWPKLEQIGGTSSQPISVSSLQSTIVISSNASTVAYSDSLPDLQEDE